MGDAARSLPSLDQPLPPEWRQLYADLAAAWIRELGTLPPSLEALAAWGAEDSGVPLDAEIAYLEGRGSDPCSSSA
jgi:hypothetical protein